MQYEKKKKKNENPQSTYKLDLTVKGSSWLHK